MALQITAVIAMKTETEGGRGLAFQAGYCPHLVVTSTSEYLGVRVLSIVSSLTPDTVFPGATAQVIFALLYYPGVSYAELRDGSEFRIMEGGNCVGTGTMLQGFMPPHS